MKPFSKLLATCALFFGFSAQVFAAGVFLVGDNNIFTTQGDNEILFQNIFNNQSVLNDTTITSPLSGLGTTAAVTDGSISAANLAGQDYLMTGFNRPAYSATERTDIVNFVNGGGSLFLIGEYNTNFSALNTSINEILLDIGSTMSLSLTQNLIDAGPVDLVSVSNSTSFGAGVNAWHTDGAQSLINLGLNGQAVVSGQDPRPCSIGSVPVCDGVGEIGTVVALENLSPIPVPAAIWLFGTALIGFVGMSRRRKVS